MSTRLERHDDADQVHTVHRSAFGSETHGRLPAAIAAGPQYRAEWSWVADLDGTVVGHAMASWTFLDLDQGGTVEVPHLSPLAVHPDHQRRGVGAALIESIITAVDSSGAPFLLLEGAPGYYARFGFDDARRYGVRFTLPTWAPPDAGQLRPLSAYVRLAGAVRYPPTFVAASGG